MATIKFSAATGFCFSSFPRAVWHTGLFTALLGLIPQPRTAVGSTLLSDHHFSSLLPKDTWVVATLEVFWCVVEQKARSWPILYDPHTSSSPLAVPQLSPSQPEIPCDAQLKPKVDFSSPTLLGRAPNSPWVWTRAATPGQPRHKPPWMKSKGKPIRRFTTSLRKTRGTCTPSKGWISSTEVPKGLPVPANTPALLHAFLRPAKLVQRESEWQATLGGCEEQQIVEMKCQVNQPNTRETGGKRQFNSHALTAQQLRRAFVAEAEHTNHTSIQTQNYWMKDKSIHRYFSCLVSINPFFLLFMSWGPGDAMGL